MEISNIIQQYSDEKLSVGLTTLLNNAAKQATERLEEDKLVHQLEATTLKERPRKPAHCISEVCQYMGEFMDKHKIEETEPDFAVTFFTYDGVDVAFRHAWIRSESIPSVRFALFEFLNEDLVPTAEDLNVVRNSMRRFRKTSLVRMFDVHDNFKEF